MDIRTGEIVEVDSNGIAWEQDERGNVFKYDIQHLAPIKRGLTAAEKSQRQINLYSPCGCGSGQKFKFCCRKVGES